MSWDMRAVCSRRLSTLPQLGMAGEQATSRCPQAEKRGCSANSLMACLPENEKPPGAEKGRLAPESGAFFVINRVREILDTPKTARRVCGNRGFRSLKT